MNRPALAPVLIAAFVGIGGATTVLSQQPGVGFSVEATFPLGDVVGRIDHLAIDVAGGLLFVAELRNGSVSVIDLAAGAVVARATGLAEPQGIAFLPATRTIYVATGGDGLLHSFSVPDLVPGPTLAIGADADNIRVHPSGTMLAVGFANGIAIVDPAAGAVTASIPLAGHAEGFSFDVTGTRIFVNVPEAGQIAVIDVATVAVVAEWPTGAAGANFPMALDGDRVLAGLRSPPELGVYDTATGTQLGLVPMCEDSDDLFTDQTRGLVYVICGGRGRVQTFARSGEGYTLRAETPTALAARTGLFVPELDRLFVAVPASSTQAASIWVLVPAG